MSGFSRGVTALIPFVLLNTLGASAPANLERSIEQIERSFHRGQIGVGVANLKTGKTWFYRGEQRFPMQSTFKFPLAATVFDAVDHGKLKLEKRIRVTKSMLSVPVSTVNERVLRNGTTEFTVEELVRLAVSTSDNTAADLLAEQIGGPEAETRFLRVHGIRDIRIDRMEKQIQPDSVGLDGFHPAFVTERGIHAALDRVPPKKSKAAMAAYLDDPRDTATPKDVIQLLVAFDKGQLLSKSSTARLRQIMIETTTGAARLKAGLPMGTVLAHKTGTGRSVQGVCGAVNDLGIASLPDGRRFAIMVFLKGTSGTMEQREGAIAKIARLIANQKER